MNMYYDMGWTFPQLLMWVSVGITVIISFRWVHHERNKGYRSPDPKYHGWTFPVLLCTCSHLAAYAITSKGLDDNVEAHIIYISMVPLYLLFVFIRGHKPEY